MKKEQLLLVSLIIGVLLLDLFIIKQNNIIMNSSKTDIKKIAEMSIEAVKNGETDALPEYIEARKQAEYYNQIAKELQPYAIEEREKYPEPRLLINGTKIELSYSGDRLDYSQDSVWNELNELKKQRENVLKTAFKSDFTMVDDNGEVVPKVGIKTHGKQIIKISY
jgi:hypothetical protein